jgi:hypothetical protein
MPCFPLAYLISILSEYSISEDGSRPWIPTVDDLLAKDWTVV